jgi:acetyl esterase
MDPEAERFCTARDLQVRGANGSLPARLYEPHDGADEGGGLVFFHGGGFVFGSLAIYDALCRRLAHASRARLLSVGYRLAPEHPWPAQHEDALASALWVWENAGELGFDRDRIGLAGDSAGGHMALWTASRLDRETHRPRALILLYPLLSLEDAEWSAAPLESLRIIGRIAVAYIRRQLASDTLIEEVLPDGALETLPPTLLVSGGLDPVRPDAAPFAERLRRAGVPMRTLEFAALIHGELNLTHLSSAARRALKETGETVAELLSD